MRRSRLTFACARTVRRRRLFHHQAAHFEASQCRETRLDGCRMGSEVRHSPPLRADRRGAAPRASSGSALAGISTSNARRIDRRVDLHLRHRSVMSATAVRTYTVVARPAGEVGVLNRQGAADAGRRPASVLRRGAGKRCPAGASTAAQSSLNVRPLAGAVTPRPQPATAARSSAGVERHTGERLDDRRRRCRRAPPARRAAATASPRRRDPTGRRPVCRTAPAFEDDVIRSGEVRR